MTWLLVIGAIVGYLFAGGIAMYILTEVFDAPEEDGILLSLFWPLAAVFGLGLLVFIAPSMIGDGVSELADAISRRRETKRLRADAERAELRRSIAALERDNGIGGL